MIDGDKIHRYINTTLLVIAIGVGIVLVNNFTHNLHDCEERLFEKLTNQKAPKGIK